MAQRRVRAASKPAPANAQTSPFEGSLILRPKLRDQLWPILGMLFCGIGGTFSAVNSNSMGQLGIFFAIGLGCWVVFNTLPGGASLRLTSMGFEARTLFRTISLRWDEVTPFHVYDRTNLDLWTLELVAWRRGGEIDWLPISFGLPPAKLAALMNAWQRRATGNLVG
jgi:hypothetical protein